MLNLKITSIRHKFALIGGIFFVVFVLGFLLINHLFLEKYYIYELESEMALYAEEILSSYNSEENGLSLANNRAFQNRLRKMSDATGHRLEIIDRNSQVLISSVPEFNPGDHIEFPKNMTGYLEENFENIDESGSATTVLRTPEGDQSLVLSVSSLSNGYYLLITAQLDEIQDNVAIANRFFLGIGIILTFVWTGLIYALSKTITSPIIGISHQAKAIAAFDFSKSYRGQTVDEIGQLGEHMNHISGELENRITELRAMNLELKDEMSLQRRFLASISHEFKSPVGIIKGYAESIKLGYYNNDIERNNLVDRILTSSDQLSALVEDMVMLSKLDKREFILNKERVNLSDLMDQTCRKIEGLYPNAPVSFDMNIQRDIVFACDRIRMIQIFDNLLINGFRYTAAPWHFKAAMFQASESIHIVFSNSCKVMEAEDIEQIFSPFYRFEKSHNKKTGGHGLGLSVVKALVEAHGGTIEAGYYNGMFTIEIRFSNDFT